MFRERIADGLVPIIADLIQICDFLVLVVNPLNSGIESKSYYWGEEDKQEEADKMSGILSTILD